MLPPFAERHQAPMRIERFSCRPGVIARLTPMPDTASRILDLRRLAMRYNSMLDQTRPPMRSAR